MKTKQQEQLQKAARAVGACSQRHVILSEHVTVKAYLKKSCH